MESLAQMAASQNEVNTVDGETYIEKYIKGVSAVESILTLDRLRQVRTGSVLSLQLLFVVVLVQVEKQTDTGENDPCASIGRCCRLILFW